MTILTQEKFKKIIPMEDDVESFEWYTSLAPILDKYEINTSNRIAGFLSQVGHESNMFKSMHENLFYSAEGLMKVFHTHFENIGEASKYAKHPQMIANKVYANRMGNDDENSGDGYRYCGRGLLQTTGKDNYTEFASHISMSLPDACTYIETKAGAIESAAYFWYKHTINSKADSKDVLAMTKIVNGGENGYYERLGLFNDFIKILGE